MIRPIATLPLTPRKARIVGCLRLGPMTRPELCKRLALQRTSVQSDLVDLASLGRVRPAGCKRGRVGAPATVWELAA